MKKIKTWLVYKKYFQTSKNLIMVALATDMDCRYHPRIYRKSLPRENWHCCCEDGCWYKGPNGYENASKRVMELFHSEFDNMNPVEINYAENNLSFAGSFKDEITMKEDIIDCLKKNFPSMTFGFI